MKKHFLVFIIMVCLLFINIPFAYSQPIDNTNDVSITVELLEELLPSPSLSAEGATVIEQKTGKVLYGKDEHKRLYPASTTKVLTGLLAIELGNLDDLVTVGDEVNMVAWDGSKAGLVQNEEITLENLVYGLLINSGNDAANTIAVHIARKVSGKELGTQEAIDYFSGLMNERAVKAGALDSNFVSPHGYHDPNHYTTAYDLAMIGRAAMEHEFFRKVVATPAMDTTYWSTGQPRYWRSKDKLIKKDDPEYYEYATGGKTGYTSKAGQCLISFASKDGLDLVSVVFKSATSQQWSDSRKLFGYGFSNFTYQQVLQKGSIVETLPVENFASDDWGSLAVEIASDDQGAVFRKQDIPEIERIIQWDESLLAPKKDNTDILPKLMAPIEQGQVIGELTIMLKGEVIAKSPLTAVRDVKKKTVIDIIRPDSKGFNYVILLLSILGAYILLRIIVLIINQKRRRNYMYRR